jgi:hypothetical protein
MSPAERLDHWIFSAGAARSPEDHRTLSRDYTGNSAVPNADRRNRVHRAGTGAVHPCTSISHFTEWVPKTAEAHGHKKMANLVANIQSHRLETDLDTLFLLQPALKHYSSCRDWLRKLTDSKNMANLAAKIQSHRLETDLDTLFLLQLALKPYSSWGIGTSLDLYRQELYWYYMELTSSYVGV